MEILAANGLVKSYSRRRVVDGVSLEVRAGEIVGLLGPNGAGKSTSFKMMCGLVTPDRGSVFLQGIDVTNWPLHRRSREGGMAYLPQKSSVFSKLSVQDNLKGMMQLLGFSRKQQKVRTEELLEQFKIGHIRKSKAGKLSGGEMRRLEIARCLVANPKIIMLDEPFAGIDPVTVQGVQVVIRELADAGIAVLITDHAAREILQITQRTYVVSQGRILCSGTADQIVAHPEVRQKYLGDIDMVPSTEGATNGANQVGTAQAIAVAQQLLAAQQSNQLASAAQKVAVAEPQVPVRSKAEPGNEGGQSVPNQPVPSPVNKAPIASPAQKSVAADQSASKKTNNIPLPHMPVKQGRRVRKVVAPFKSTDLD